MLDSFFRNTLSPGQWVLIAAIPPAILALYFLKLKRVPLEVPSTFLWRKSIEDLHVNSFWQRLRRSLLLFLQLLLVGLAILALLRPGWQGTKLEGERLIFVLDNSASMSATDVDQAETRLGLAKKQVAGLIDQMERGMSAMIISFADSPQVVQEFTSNRRLLKERLDLITSTAQSTDLLGALKLADGLANPGQMLIEEGMPEIEVIEPSSTTMYLFTDGRFSDVKDFSLGNLNPIYVPIGSGEANNLAITAFSTRRNEARPEERQAFVQVTNLSEELRTVEVEITLDGDFLDARRADVPPGESAGLTFPLADASAGALQASLSLGDIEAVDDVLPIDNVAYAALNENRRGQTLVVTPGNPVLEAVLKTERADRSGEIEFISPTVLDSDEHKRRARAGDYDLILYDRCAPAKMPHSHTLFLGAVPKTPAWNDDTPSDVTQLPQIIDWNRAHPLLAYVELSDLWIYEAQVLTPPANATLLVESTAGPLMAVAPRESFEDVVLGYPILTEKEGQTMGNTKWFHRRSFPTFWLNVLDYLVGQSSESERASISPGEATEVRPRTNVSEIQIIRPDGQTRRLKREGQSPFPFHETDQPGVYEVREGGQVTQRFAANLFDRNESAVRLQWTGADSSTGQEFQSLRIGFIDVDATRGAAPARKELWKALLLLALGVLMLEWWVYNRRVYL